MTHANKKSLKSASCNCQRPTATCAAVVGNLTPVGYCKKD
jgi:hypothetical protein